MGSGLVVVESGGQEFRPPGNQVHLRRIQPPRRGGRPQIEHFPGDGRKLGRQPVGIDEQPRQPHPVGFIGLVGGFVDIEVRLEVNLGPHLIGLKGDGLVGVV